MKKSYKPTIVLTLLFSITAVVFLFVYVGMKIKIDSFQKERVDLKNRIIALDNERVRLTADYQTFVDDSVRLIAGKRLQLVDAGSITATIKVNERRIEEIEKKVRLKYEH